ncbi:MAG TPA: Ig-like domain-containing protein, partial [Vicinamibacterales bacterium]|nr:Ig-like domain-containing protein [Vicinamibacterales bacterium]
MLGAAAALPRAGAPDPAEDLAILPGTVVLRGQGSRQQLLVEARQGNAYVGDRTPSCTFTSSNPNVATVDAAGVVTAVADGRAIVTAREGSRAVSVVVEVERAFAPYAPTFRNHVIPVLSKAGCNSGPCHGALAGKNGFKLTLRGYDPEVDYVTLTRQAAARRIDKVDPARSLMLLKPTLAVAHGGGKRLVPGSPEYRVIAQWIAAGTPAPADWDPVMTRLEVFPASARLKPGDTQPILVRAHFSDGHAEDVTRWAKFASNEGSVASVGEDGLVKVEGSGEAAISAWYLSQLVTARITSPFPARIDPAVYARAPRG